jgi:hypothetical protein
MYLQMSELNSKRFKMIIGVEVELQTTNKVVVIKNINLTFWLNLKSKI